MQPLHNYRVPIPHRNDTPFAAAVDIPAFSSRVTDVVFKLRVFGIDGVEQYIYECTLCRGCGCPAFPMGVEIPEEVEEHLRLHVEMCEGLVRYKVSQ